MNPAAYYIQFACLERNRLVHFRKRRLLKPPRFKSKTGCPEVDLLTEFHCIIKFEECFNMFSLLAEWIVLI